MDTEDQPNCQRVQHIIDSYHLDGHDKEAFADCLIQLLGMYPQPLIELALTESIVKGWSEIPMPRGMRFIQRVHDRLHCWQPGLEPGPQLNQPLQTSPCATSVDAIWDTKTDIKTIQLSAVKTEFIDTSLTPEQFAQITGLDPSLVFDESGTVRLA